MSEINCCGDEEVYGEVFPGWILVRLVNVDDSCNTYSVNGFDMVEGSFGLTFSNDPSFIFDLTPIKDFDFDSDNPNILEKEQKYLDALDHYRLRLFASVEAGYDLILAATKVGYNPKEGGLASFLMDKMVEALQNGVQKVWKK